MEMTRKVWHCCRSAGGARDERQRCHDAVTIARCPPAVVAREAKEGLPLAAGEEA